MTMPILEEKNAYDNLNYTNNDNASQNKLQTLQYHSRIKRQQKRHIVKNKIKLGNCLCLSRVRFY